MNDGVVLCVEGDAHRVRRRLETRYLDEQASSRDDAVARCRAAAAEKRGLSVGLEGNAADVFGAEPAAAEPAVDVTVLHAKIGELTLANDFLAGALGKAGLLPSAKR